MLNQSMATVRKYWLVFLSIMISNELSELGVIHFLQRYNIKMRASLFMSVTTNMARREAFDVISYEFNIYWLSTYE